MRISSSSESWASSAASGLAQAEGSIPAAAAWRKMLQHRAWAYWMYPDRVVHALSPGQIEVELQV